ncbi:MAG: hypothetical protein E7Z91_07415 [Cyanobacteria bacterium SIG30]|nr:hypothetical protein [Cyanobacteria bacterium SIG30]
MIIVLGSEDDFHSRYIYEKLCQRKQKVAYLDTRKYPTFSWSANDLNSYIILNNAKISTEDIKGLYWRWYYGVTNCETDIVYREKTSALESLLYSLEEKSYNSLQSVELHRKKGYQSLLMHKNGIAIPNTIITSDKNIVEEFYNNNNKNVIYKPVRGGAFAQKLSEEDFKRLDLIINCPVQFQECIDGVDIRVYAFKTGEIYAGEIIVDCIDFRKDAKAQINKINLPEHVKKDCLKILELLGLKYSGIDIRRTKDDKYVFIEANPAPMFVHFENTTGYQITETLINNLIY